MFGAHNPKDAVGLCHRLGMQGKGTVIFGKAAKLIPRKPTGPSAQWNEQLHDSHTVLVLTYLIAYVSSYRNSP